MNSVRRGRADPVVPTSKAAVRPPVMDPTSRSVRLVSVPPAHDKGDGWFAAFLERLFKSASGFSPGVEGGRGAAF